MISREKLMQMPYEELYKLSLQKNSNGSYTYNAKCAYDERRRRSKYIKYDGVSNRCNKFRNDQDYYGTGDW